MKDYIVYFEIYGKKMKTTVLAASKNAAEMVVRNNLKIIKVKEDNPDVINDIFNLFK